MSLLLVSMQPVTNISFKMLTITITLYHNEMYNSSEIVEAEVLYERSICSKMWKISSKICRIKQTMPYPCQRNRVLVMACHMLANQLTSFPSQGSKASIKMSCKV